MAKLRAYIPSVSVTLTVTVLKGYTTIIDGEEVIRTKEETAYDFKNLTYTSMSNEQIKEQEKGREDYFKKYREAFQKEETERLLNIKLNSLPSVEKAKAKELERVKKERGRISDKILTIQEEIRTLTKEMKEITDNDPDKFENLIKDEFEISINGGDLEELIGVIESDEYPQITYYSVLKTLQDEAKEEKGN